jgi:uncharacterized OB-fold protein
MSQEKTRPFKDGLFESPQGSEKEARLVGVHCRACGKYAFPPRPLCIFCHSKDVEKTHLSPKGRLHSFTICHIPVPQMHSPYAVGYVDLPEGVRVFSQLENWADGALRVDMDMELVIGRIKTDPEGKDVLSYKFRPSS